MWDFDEDSFITLTDENGNEVDFLLMDVMEYDGSDYMVLLPLTDEDGEEEEEELFSSMSKGRMRARCTPPSRMTLCSTPLLTCMRRNSSRR